MFLLDFWDSAHWGISFKSHHGDFFCCDKNKCWDKSVMWAQKSAVCWCFRVRISMWQGLLWDSTQELKGGGGLSRAHSLQRLLSNPQPIASLQAWCLFSYFIKNQQRALLEGSKEGQQQPEKGKCNFRALKPLLKVEAEKVQGVLWAADNPWRCDSHSLGPETIYLVILY